MATKPFTDSTSEIPSENLPYLRAYVARTIESLVGVLDALDRCCDLEDDDPLENSDEDRCEAFDDDLGISLPGDIGTPEDAEDDNEDCCRAFDDRICGQEGIHAGFDEDCEPDNEDWQDPSTPPHGAHKSYEQHRARKLTHQKLAWIAPYNGKPVKTTSTLRVEPDRDLIAATEADRFLEEHS